MKTSGTKRIFLGNMEFSKGIEAPKINGVSISETQILDDKLQIYVKN